MYWLQHFIQDPALVLIAITLAAYAIGTFIYQLFGKTPFLHPVLIGVVFVNAMLAVLSLDYAAYFEKAKLFHLLLGPTVVCLAVPIYEHFGTAKATILPLMISIGVCGVFIVLSTILIANLMGMEADMVNALITRSVTAPIALAINEKVNGNAGFAILVVFLTGLFSVIVSPYVFRAFQIKDHRIQGFTLGMTAHTFGVARALEISSQAAAFATLGMGLFGGLAAFVIPFVLTNYQL